MTVRAASVDLAALDALSVESYVVFLASDERPPAGFAGLVDWRLAGALSRLVADGLVTGATDDALLSSTHGLAEGHQLSGARLFVFGIGTTASDPVRFAAVAERAVERLRKAGVRTVAVGVPGHGSNEATRAVLQAAFAKLPEADVVIATAQQRAPSASSSASSAPSAAARQAPVP